MSGRAVTYALTRKRVLIPGLIGIGFILGNVSTFFGVGFIAFAVLQASRLLSHNQLDDLLRLREEKRRHRIGRMLNNAERNEILMIDRYAQTLKARGADPTLGQATMDEAWRIIQQAQYGDASAALRTFRLGLPPLDGSGEVIEKPTIAGKIARELDILHATHKEVESLS